MHLADTRPDNADSPYLAWLIQNRKVPLYRVRDTWWQVYRKTLIPASAGPCFIDLVGDEAGELLRESGAWLVRYSTDPCDEATEWWYVVSDEAESGALSSNTRSKINRGNRNCSVRRIAAEWLSEHGYGCYFAAYARYSDANPSDETVFRRNLLLTTEGPFEYWGVFVGQELTGYCQCVVEERTAATNVVKFDPAYLRFYTSYALITHLVNHYVRDRGLVLSNGNRSVSHDTEFQSFLLKLGFKRQFCRLQVVYQPWLGSAIQATFPLRSLVSRLPGRGYLAKVQALLFQEHLRRLCR